MNMIDYEKEIQSLSTFRALKVFGGVVIFLFFGVFCVWAGYAPLEGAIIARGTITKEGRTQVVAHERGGVVQSIAVDEGQHVEEGQLLLSIEDSEKKAELAKLETRMAYSAIKELRLEAEEQRGTFDTDTLPAKLEQYANLAAFDRLVQDQEKQFTTRQRLKNRERSVLQEQKAILEQQLTGSQAELKALDDWRKILQEQVEMREILMKKGVVSKVAYQNTLKEFAEVETDYQKLKTQTESLPIQMSEIDQRLKQLVDQFNEAVSRELAELRSEKLALANELQAARKAVDRVALQSPASGTIDKLHVNTIGSAIAAYQPLVEIVPDQKRLQIEVEVRPADIDQVRVGQNARLSLSAFDPAEFPAANGRVVFISPDRRINQRTQRPYFVVRLELLPEQDTELPDLVPGMPVEAFLETGTRTFFQMVFEPVTKSMQRSFKS
ncbi:HlyD family secretion protein [Cohaesibacter marisflavi]|uniref:Membrane fusion protein (MFP) family protein n=1 Tax=Cohaesibacter marisflavi TaxID=655353 RepID=A0A1I5I4A8_9HYPH|nr:HlyD family type I secretion periplasmic adaptor subunit [Cohaesibacter marisflavi]SFO55367.1 HlyD family secretion protein [Cohaesibacter marisflavi]